MSADEMLQTRLLIRISRPSSNSDLVFGVARLDLEATKRLAFALDEGGVEAMADVLRRAPFSWPEKAVQLLVEMGADPRQVDSLRRSMKEMLR